jgi:cell division transport system permease protein
MKSWLTQHSQALKLVLRRFKANLLNTLFICLAIGVTLALPSIMYTVLSSLSGLANNVKSESQISVFLSADQASGTATSIKAALEKNALVKSFKFVSKEDALKQLETATANNNVLSSLEQNPLPDAFFIAPKNLDAASIESLKSELANLEGIEEIVVDGAWIKRLNYLILIGQKAMVIITSLLGFALVAVIGNTIRMQILTQQAEIELSQLIGATKSFIRRPFLYLGALYGLIGGLFALLITYAVISVFNQSLNTLAREYQTDFSINLPDITSGSVVCLLSLIVGLVSAYFAVSKSLFKNIN